jgi:hypothetical protein
LDGLKTKLKILEHERERARDGIMLGNALWKKLWACIQTDYRMNEPIFQLAG